MPGVELPDAAKDRPRGRNVEVGQVVVQGERIDLAGHAGGRQDALDLRGEGERGAVPPVIERLDAHPIARQEELLLRRVPDREREHSTQVAHAVLAVFLVGMKDGLCIAMGLKNMSALFQVFGERPEVVDLSVEDDRLGAVLVEDGLRATGHVDDAESSVAQPDGAVQVHGTVIRTPMGEHGGHPLHAGAGSGPYGGHVVQT